MNPTVDENLARFAREATRAYTIILDRDGNFINKSHPEGRQRCAM